VRSDGEMFRAYGAVAAGASNAGVPALSAPVAYLVVA
jgi:hypothetical protein